MDEIINTERDKQQSKIRVAAYCRVVENQDEPMKAREIQRQYYIERIKENSKWELVDIFIDNKTAETKVDRQIEFDRMIDLCRQDKIDMIIVKTFSTFTRNTADFIRYMQLLKELGVDVYFEAHELHTMSQEDDVFSLICECVNKNETDSADVATQWGEIKQ